MSLNMLFIITIFSQLLLTANANTNLNYNLTNLVNLTNTNDILNKESISNIRILKSDIEQPDLIAIVASLTIFIIILFCFLIIKFRRMKKADLKYSGKNKYQRAEEDETTVRDAKSSHKSEGGIQIAGTLKGKKDKKKDEAPRDEICFDNVKRVKKKKIKKVKVEGREFIEGADGDKETKKKKKKIKKRESEKKNKEKKIEEEEKKLTPDLDNLKLNNELIEGQYLDTFNNKNKINKAQEENDNINKLSHIPYDELNTPQDQNENKQEIKISIFNLLSKVDQQEADSHSNITKSDSKSISKASSENSSDVKAKLKKKVKKVAKLEIPKIVESEGSNRSRLSAKKIVSQLVHRDLVQYTNEQRSSPESSYCSEEEEEYNSELIISSPIKRLSDMKPETRRGNVLGGSII